jgi:hypothetical protein
MNKSRILIAWLLMLAIGLPAVAANRRRRSNNQARSKQAQISAVNSAIQSAKSRVAAAEAAASSASALFQRRAAEAGQSAAHFQSAMSEHDRADNEKFGASQELNELRAKIEKFQPDDAPIKQAHREYDKAVEELAEIRADIYESDKYISLHESALESPNKTAELARVQKICFDDDPEFKEAKEHVEKTHERYNQIRYALYETDPEWAAAVKRSKEATVAANKAATTVKASAVEKGIESINAREAGKRLALAQAMLADAKGDLKRLESRKQQLQPSKTTQQKAQSNKDANKKKK